MDLCKCGSNRCGIRPTPDMNMKGQEPFKYIFDFKKTTSGQQLMRVQRLAAKPGMNSRMAKSPARTPSIIQSMVETKNNQATSTECRHCVS